MGHRSKAELADRQTGVGSVDRVPIPDPDPDWHPIARDWFISLGESGQHAFFQPSDWATARFVAEAMSRCVARDYMSANMFGQIMSAASELLSTEGARRRLRMELQRRDTDPGVNAGVTAINDYKKRITG